MLTPLWVILVMLVLSKWLEMHEIRNGHPSHLIGKQCTSAHCTNDTIFSKVHAVAFVCLSRLENSLPMNTKWGYGESMADRLLQYAVHCKFKVPRNFYISSEITQGHIKIFLSRMCFELRMSCNILLVWVQNSGFWEIPIFLSSLRFLDKFNKCYILSCIVYHGGKIFKNWPRSFKFVMAISQSFLSLKCYPSWKKSLVTSECLVLW